MDAEELGALAEPHRLRLGTALRSRPASPLFYQASLPERVVAEHRTRCGVPGPEFYGVPGYELGGFGLLQRQGRVFVHDGVQPPGSNRIIASDGMPAHWVRGLFDQNAEVVECDAPVGVVLNPQLVWGHFLMEMLARVHLLARLRTLGRPIRVAVPIDAPGWVREFASLYFSDSETVFYHSERQRVRAPSFVLPGMMMGHYHFHPELNVVVRELLDRVVGAAPPSPDKPRRLYLSRSRHNGWHSIANEAEVEATLVDLGFAVLHPQELPLHAQLAMFAGAECVVSQFGSGAHNALFAPFGTPVFCLGWMNRCQSGIAALRGQPVAYMRPADCAVIYPPDDRRGAAFSFRIDCRRLAQELPAFLSFAAARPPFQGPGGP